MGTIKSATSKIFSVRTAWCLLIIPLILAFQNCGGGFELVLNPPSTLPESETVVQGKTLYENNCSSCHGPIESSAKKTRTGEQITLAITQIPQMRAISLTPEQISAIATALSPTVNTPPPVTNEDNRQEFACTTGDVQKTPLVKLTNREYKNALFALLDGFSTSLKSDATLVAKIAAIPTDIATENRDTLKEQSLLVTAPISNAIFESSYRAGELVASATTGLQNYPNTSQCLAAATITQACHQSFARELGSRAFRRQLTVTEGNALAALYWDSTLSKTDLIKTTFAAIATMPDFLYKIYDKGTAIASGSSTLSLTAYEVAAKMAFFLTGAPPDSTLTALAANGQILTDSVMSEQVDRLLATSAANETITRFFRESYGYDVFDNFLYDATFINNINTSGLKEAMASELDGFFTQVVLNNKGSFLDIMTSRYTNTTDARLNSIYGVSSSVTTLPEIRAGFLNRAAMLTKRSGYAASPIKRGLSVIEHVLCQDIGLPPPSAPTSLPGSSEDMISTRMRTQNSTEATGTTCVGCHGRFNSFGYAFEGFDSFGRYRTSEALYKNNAVIGTVAVNTSYTTTEITGSSVSGNSSRDLVDDLGNSDRAMMCFVKHLKRFEARIPAEATANCQMNQSLKVMYGDNTTQGSIVGAIKALVMSPEFRRWKN